MLELTVYGDPAVKKNNQKVVWVGRFPNKKPVKIDTPFYKEWKKQAEQQLAIEKKPAEPIDYPVNLKCLFFKRTRGTVDLSALYEGIQDELVTAGFLADDNYKIVAGHDGSRVIWDKENPRIEVTIERMK